MIVISAIRNILGNVALWKDKLINSYGDKWLSLLTVKYILEGYIRQNGQRWWSLTHNHLIRHTNQIPTELNGTETRNVMKYITMREGLRKYSYLAILNSCVGGGCRDHNIHI